MRTIVRRRPETVCRGSRSPCQQFLNLLGKGAGQQVVPSKSQVDMFIKQVLAGQAVRVFFGERPLGVGQQHTVLITPGGGFSD